MLETERLRLELWQEEDWQAFRPIATDPRVMHFLTGGEPWPDEQTRRWVRWQTIVYWRFGFCMWKLRLRGEDRLIGFCGLQPLVVEGKADIEIGWWLAPDLWGKGLATEAARRALGDGFIRCGLRRIVAVAHRENAASIQVMKKIGLRYGREVVYKGTPSVLYLAERKNRTGQTAGTAGRGNPSA